MKITLGLTHRCTLACRYCYAGRATKQDMSLETAQRCVDFALKRTPAGKKVTLCLFGGEPLLRFDLARAITIHARERAAELGCPVEVTLTTNGTLIDQAVLDFAADQRVRLCFSLDGPADVHDRHRVYPDGRGSFDDVFRGLAAATRRLDSVQVNAVFGPDTVSEIPRSLRFFVDSGVAAVHFNPNITATWPEATLTRLRDVYMQAADYYVACYAQRRSVAVNFIDSKMILFMKDGYAPEDRCSMGAAEWGFAPSGNIYPCERFIGDDSDPRFCLGNVATGMHSIRCQALRQACGNRNPECLTCASKKYCMNWCGCTNYFMSGHTDLAAPALCAMERATIQAARHVFDSLVKDGNELFAEHMYGYVEASNHAPSLLHR
jgi:uncharacterized protein